MALLPLLMILASVWMGGYRYWQTKNQMRQDLNRALQQMVLQEPEQQWLIDSLSALPPEGILTPSGRKNPFHHHLSMNPLRDTAHFSVCLAGNEQSFAERAMVCSDTLMWSVDRAGAGHTTLVLKAFANPMLIAMLIGMIIGLTGIRLPQWTSNMVSSLGTCMSPVAMLLTGVTVSKIQLKKTRLQTFLSFRLGKLLRHLHYGHYIIFHTHMTEDRCLLSKITDTPL